MGAFPVAAGTILGTVQNVSHIHICTPAGGDRAAIRVRPASHSPPFARAHSLSWSSGRQRRIVGHRRVEQRLRGWSSVMALGRARLADGSRRAVRPRGRLRIEVSAHRRLVRRRGVAVRCRVHDTYVAAAVLWAGQIPLLYRALGSLGVHDATARYGSTTVPLLAVGALLRLAHHQRERLQLPARGLPLH